VCVLVTISLHVFLCVYFVSNFSISVSVLVTILLYIYFCVCSGDNFTTCISVCVLPAISPGDEEDYSRRDDNDDERHDETLPSIREADEKSRASKDTSAASSPRKVFHF
jgi:hypothetical protein